MLESFSNLQLSFYTELTGSNSIRQGRKAHQIRICNHCIATRHNDLNFLEVTFQQKFDYLTNLMHLWTHNWHKKMFPHYADLVKRDEALDTYISTIILSVILNCQREQMSELNEPA